MNYLLLLFLLLAYPIELFTMQPCRSNEIKTEHIGLAPISLNAGYPQILSVRSGFLFDFLENPCERFALDIYVEPGITGAKGIFAVSLEGYYSGIYVGLGYLYNYLLLTSSMKQQYLGGEFGLRVFNLNLNAGLYFSQPLLTETSDLVLNLQIGYTFLNTLRLQ